MHLSSSLTYLLATQSVLTHAALTYITLEEHVAVPAFQKDYNAVGNVITKNATFALLNDCDTVNGTRLQSMNANGIRVQVMSAGPNPILLNQTAKVKKANDQLAQIRDANPSRFAAFCYLPMAFPRESAKELERCVKDLGMKGALIENHLLNGTYFDGTQFEPIWAMAEKLNVPIYLHPTYPAADDVLFIGGHFAPTDNDFSSVQAALMATSAWSWHTDTGYHFLRLFSAGVFEKYPKLKMILGHMGEAVPYMLDRTNALLSGNSSRATLMQTWQRNVWVTTSGFFGQNTTATLFRTTAKDRIMVSNALSCINAGYI